MKHDYVPKHKKPRLSLRGKLEIFIVSLVLIFIVGALLYLSFN